MTIRLSTSFPASSPQPEAGSSGGASFEHTTTLEPPFSSRRGATNVDPGRHDQLPSFWSSLKSRRSSHDSSTSIRGLLRGWRLVVFHSWLNLLLVFVPVTWTLDFLEVKSHRLVFALSIMGLIPLVKLHDLCTRELAIRIGGNKTGLINASLSNMVEIVVSISALRRCELRIVQSALVGSVLSKLLLVLGLCFFAGGMRFSEQGFDATATQMHSSLLSISVGAILLPAVYHFTLEDRTAMPIARQGRDILHMSHGVSIVLLFIYSAYLVFQLWSHKHLYHDGHNKKSEPLPVQVRVNVPKSAHVFKHAGKRIGASLSALDLTKSGHHPTTNSDIELDQRPYHQLHSMANDSQLTLNGPSEDVVPNEHTLHRNAQASTIRLISRPTKTPLDHDEMFSSNQQNRTSSPDITISPEDLTQSGLSSGEKVQEPNDLPKSTQMSWTITLGVMVIVTIVVAVTAESLVESMDGISQTINKEWIGLIVLPSVSAIAECITAVNVSVRDELTLSVSVAVGWSIQTTLFVLPFMVILAWITNKPLSLLLDPFHSLVLYLSVQIMSYVVADGKSNWLEGMILICLYVIVAVSFWFYPGSNVPDSLAHCAASIPDPI